MCTRIADFHLTWGAGEDLRDVEGLRQEALDLARARDGHLVLLAQLVHAQDGNDILQVLVVLQSTLLLCIRSGMPQWSNNTNAS